MYKTEKRWPGRKRGNHGKHGIRGFDFLNFVWKSVFLIPRIPRFRPSPHIRSKTQNPRNQKCIFHAKIWPKQLIFWHSADSVVSAFSTWLPPSDRKRGFRGIKIVFFDQNQTKNSIFGIPRIPWFPRFRPGHHHQIENAESVESISHSDPTKFCIPWTKKNEK